MVNMTLLKRLNLLYMRKLFATPEGRAHVLAQAADSEASGEAAIFDQTLAKVDDPELARLIRKHRDDELRHEKLFRERLAAQNAPYQLPEELRLVARIDREAGGILDRPITDARGVLGAYALLQSLEERAVSSFALFIAAMEEPDPQTARVFAEVLEDEKRHLKYCIAVSRRYAKSEEERLEGLERMRAIEARAFHGNQMANMRFTLARGWIGGPLETALWRVVRALALSLPQLAPTPAAREDRRGRSGRVVAAA
jgi:rubrerythrin